MKKVFIFLLLFVFAVISITPLYWMFVTAFSSPELTSSFPPKLFPVPLNLDNIKEILADPYIFRWTINSLTVSFIVTVFVVYFSTMSGYVFAKAVFPGRKFIFFFYLISMMIPFQIVVVPLYILCGKLNLIDTYPGLIFPAVAGPFGVFLMKQFLNSFPVELIEAAKLDGCSEIKCFHKIILPLSIPGITVLGTFTFVGQWNSFLWPLIITESTEMKVLQAGLAHLQSLNEMRYAYLMAGAAYAAVPIVIVFFFFQKYFLKGIKIGQLKY